MAPAPAQEGRAGGRLRPAARGEGDRGVLRLRRRRQDLGRGGDGTRRRESPGRQGARLDHRPGAPPRDRARSRGSRQPRPPRAAGGAQGGGARRPGRAVGRDARHEAVVGRPRPAPRARRGDRVPDPREPAVPQPHCALRAESRLHRDGAAVRDPLERCLRPHHHRHPADAERGRLPRRAVSDERVLRGPAAALAHPSVPRGRQARQSHAQRREPALLPDGRSHSRQPVPRGHRGVLLELPVHVRRFRRSRRSPWSGSCTTSARPSRS